MRRLHDSERTAMPSIVPGFSDAADIVAAASRRNYAWLGDSATFTKQPAYDELGEVSSECRTPNWDADDELLARFITQAKQFRPSDQSVKPDLFIPFRFTELSVTRHREATIEELWRVGRDVAAGRQQVLYGRSDVRASHCAIEPLSV